MSLLTLHYSIGEDDAEALVSTFGGNPATLALGGGELAPALERCLEGLAPGARQVFVLAAGQAFGQRREDLVQALPRAQFPADMDLAPGAVVEFAAPDGSRHAGQVRLAGDHDVVVDFNHPLAGRAVRFEVEVLSVL